jgi:hypothetical protein
MPHELRQLLVDVSVGQRQHRFQACPGRDIGHAVGERRMKVTSHVARE